MKFKVVYVLCPSKLVTGGTEALHQLVDGIVKLGGNSKIVYYDQYTIGIKKSVPIKFRHYQIEVANTVEDAYMNAIVVPEVSAHILGRYDNCKKFFWWLSADYCPPESLNVLKSMQVTHLYQSEYARLRILEQGLEEKHSLSDYISVFPIKQKSKRKTVALSTRKIDSRFKELHTHVYRHFTCQGVKNKSRIGLSKMFSRSVLFIDFGLHPGKDRLPREAVLFGCRLITSNNGSCGNLTDVPIDPTCKISSKISSKEMTHLINAQLRNSKSDIYLETYCTRIKNEKRHFYNEISEIFNLTMPARIPVTVNFEFYFWSYLEHIQVFFNRFLKFGN